MTESLASSRAYRPHLDGLRAVAVYLVVVFHAGSGGFAGGFVGVDVFFVLSGFLVTQLLLRDLVSVGSIGLRRFYARRFRRLLPAAFVVLVVTALVFSALASPVEVSGAEGGFRASFLYWANWHFVAQASDYFGADLTANPVVHFWSLAVEEQFYLVWPLLLGGLFVMSRRFGDRQWLVLRAVVLSGAVVSLGWALSLRTSNPNRAYYGTDARAYQLMAGALLALTPAVFAGVGRFTRTARWVAVAAVAALVVTASSLIDVGAIERGAIVTAITVIVLIAVETAAGGTVHQGLTLNGVVYLGKISYSTYLWHWPVIIVTTRAFDLSTPTTIALTALIATALASLSYQLLEHPIRTSTLLDRYRTPVIATGLALSITSALVIIPTITNQPTTQTSITNGTLTTTGFTPVPTNIDYIAIGSDETDLTNCFRKPATACTLVHGTGPHLFLMGDSHAGMLIPTFTTIANQQHLTLSVSVGGACPWQRNLDVTQLVRFGQAAAIEQCNRQRDDAYSRVVPELAPDVVIVVNAAYEARRSLAGYLGSDGGRLRKGSAEHRAWLAGSTTRSLEALRASGRKVVLVEPTPYAGDAFDPLVCLSDATVEEACRFVADSDPSDVERLYRRLDANNDNVWSANIDELTCPFLPICDPIVGRNVVRRDSNHLTEAFARSIAPELTHYLKRIGVIP